MKIECKRIFISDFPETTTPSQLENAINNYGNVASVEIKERKELGPKNSSLFFAYVNAQIDDRSLQQCFKDFASKKWFGQSITLQVARESFLDRLKREREEKGAAKINVSTGESSSFQQKEKKLKVPTIKYEQDKVKKHKLLDSENEDIRTLPIEKEAELPKKYKKDRSNRILGSSEEETKITPGTEILDLKIKNNKGKTVDRNGLKIESVGKSPILKIDKSKKKTIINSSEANLKRLQSLNNLKKAHKNKKLSIQRSLSNIDNRLNKKIVFDENEINDRSNLIKNKSQHSLFDDEHEEDEFEPNFEIKEQFQGAKGKKLLELQTRYKNDKRFDLNERFLDEGVNEEENENCLNDNVDISLEEEKKKDLEILEQVLGKKVSLMSQKTESASQKKVMLRFDPAQPEHSKFELKSDVTKKKKKKVNLEVEILNEKKVEEKEVPEVSKEVFYKVAEDLKSSLKEKQEFSLLSMFGRIDGEDEGSIEESSKEITTKAHDFVTEKNPFRYDSSDNEDEIVDIPNKEDTDVDMNQTRINNRNSFWSEPFFFTNDDYRLQEGVDFVERMNTKEESDFTKLRRDLKEIVKAKVRNNQRKNRPFKKKLGGSKRKKMLRIKKALKR